jgi:hypothetical protein
MARIPSIRTVANLVVAEFRAKAPSEEDLLDFICDSYRAPFGNLQTQKNIVLNALESVPEARRKIFKPSAYSALADKYADALSWISPLPNSTGYLAYKDVLEGGVPPEVAALLKNDIALSEKTLGYYVKDDARRAKKVLFERGAEKERNPEYSIKGRLDFAYKDTKRMLNEDLRKKTVDEIGAGVFKEAISRFSRTKKDDILRKNYLLKVAEMALSEICDPAEKTRYQGILSAAKS